MATIRTARPTLKRVFEKIERSASLVDVKYSTRAPRGLSETKVRGSSREYGRESNDLQFN